MRHHTILIIAIAACALAACGKSPGERAAEAAIEASTGNKVDVDSKSGAVTIESEEGGMKITGGDGTKLPASFPKDVYLPSDYTVESAMEAPDVLVVTLATKGKIGTLADAAGKHMAAQGWKQSFVMQNAADSQMAVYEKDKRSATVSFSAEGEKITLGLQIATQKQ